MRETEQSVESIPHVRFFLPSLESESGRTSFFFWQAKLYVGRVFFFREVGFVSSAAGVHGYKFTIPYRIVSSDFNIPLMILKIFTVIIFG